MNKYVIIGAGIAGIEAAKAIRERDSGGLINIFTAEKNLPYSRPMLTKTPLQFRILRTGPYMIIPGTTNGISLHTDRRITSIDSGAMHICDGESIFLRQTHPDSRSRKLCTAYRRSRQQGRLYHKTKRRYIRY